METDVLQNDDVAVLHVRAKALGVFADDVLGHFHLATEDLGKTLGDGSQGVLGLELSLGTTKMRAQNDLRIVRDQVFDRGQRGVDARFVGNDAVLHGDVEVNADEYLFAGDVNVFDRFLVHKFLAPFTLL